MYVKQRFQTDCGVACLAMLANVPWEVAEFAIDTATPWKWRKYSTNTKQIRLAAKLLDLDTDQNRLVTLKSDEDLWTQVPDNSLVKIPKSGTSQWHWVVFRNGKIYDPSWGVYKVDKYSRNPSSYMEFYDNGYYN